MNPERWPGEPLVERLTIDERHEVQASYVRRWNGAKRRQRVGVQKAAEATAEKQAKAARRAAFSVPQAPCSTWQPYRGVKQPHPTGQRPYQRWDGRAARGADNLPR